MKKQLIDAGSEVAEIHSSVEGVRILMDLLANDAVPNDDTGRVLPRCSVALLNLIGARLKQFGQTLNGSRDPAELVAHFNRALGDGGTGINGWSPEQREQEALRQVRKVTHERKSRARR